jgi:DNA-directed RNA polymerase specialized sigma24 family protein
MKKKKRIKNPPKKILNDPLLGKTTEKDFLEAWEKISKKLGYKFKFGYHSHEDMKQQAAIFALEGLKNYDKKRPLENFLWTHVRNRLFNYKRDNYQRPDKPCLTCPFYKPNDPKNPHECVEFSNKNECSLYSSWLLRNESKKNIMKPVTIEKIQENSKEITIDNFINNISNQEIIKIIDENISIKNRPIFLKLLGGIKIPKPEINKLVKEIKTILNNHDIRS